MAYEDYDYSEIEGKLKQRATEKGLTYDASDLEGIKRNSQNTGAGYGKTPDQLLEDAYAGYDQRASSNGGGQTQSGGSGGGGGATDLTNQWLDYIKQRDAGVAAERQGQQVQRDALWKQYSDRATQALAVDKNDPVVRQQADAYSANEQRASKDYLNDLAEKSGPYANLRGEQRLASERVGQRTGTFESQLVGRELEAKRNEIATALQSMAGMLSAEQTRALQEQLSLLDAALGQQRIGLEQQGLDQSWQRALMQNNQFTQQLGLSAEDRSAYWDAVRRGLI